MQNLKSIKKYSLIIFITFCLVKPLFSQTYLTPASDSSFSILPHLIGFNNQMASITEPWNDYKRKSALQKSSVGLLRYPGGTVSNYWDMENNRLFKNVSVIDTSNTIPRKWIKTENVIGWLVGMYQAPNSIYNLKNAYSSMQLSHEAEPSIVFVLNMITPGADFYKKKWQRDVNQIPLSDDWWLMMDDRLSRNIKMLDEAVSFGIPVKYIEFGNEYYFGKSNAGTGTNGGAVVEPYSAGALNSGFTGAFPGNGKSYADAVNNWGDTLLKRYPEARLCAIGADANNTNPSRRNSWNQEVLPFIDKSLVPAFSIHTYGGIDQGNLNTTEDNLGKAFESWLKHWNWVKQYSNLPNDREMWITEYNSNQNKKCWGHGLMNIFMIHHWLLQKNLGLTNYHQFAQNSIHGSNLYASTRAFAMFAKASRGKTRAQPLVLNDAQKLNGTVNFNIPSVSGWIFSNKEENQKNYFITNFSDQIQLINILNIENAKGSTYNLVESAISQTYDPGEKTKTLQEILLLPAFSCILFEAGKIIPVISSMKENSRKNQTITLYPNPGKNKISINAAGLADKYEKFQLTIYNNLGINKLHILGTLEEIETKLNVSIANWSKGIYYFNFKEKNNSKTLKWLKN